MVRVVKVSLRGETFSVSVCGSDRKTVKANVGENGKYVEEIEGEDAENQEFALSNAAHVVCVPGQPSQLR